MEPFSSTLSLIVKFQVTVDYHIDDPAITILIGASYGAGNYGMCGRSYHPRFLFSWPNSRCSVMGPQQLGGVLDIIFRQQFQGQITPEMDQMAAQRREKMIQLVEKESSPYFTTSR